MNDKQPFWLSKKLDELSPQEWESLCDGCGICCLYKLEDEDTGEIFYTNIVCRLLDTGTCKCKDYEHRSQIVTTCLLLTPELVSRVKWLPATCAYRRVQEGKPLLWWHPLVSGNQNSVHDTGVSILGKTIPESSAKLNNLEDFIVNWVDTNP
ncbi:MAG: YcgN family cysteine cluster protein [Anaerolineaceae bacterium]|nr:YcgN family cysteine cluster protein [Anaerolineaceae bacterium]